MPVGRLSTLLLDQIGETDCETIGEGLLAQPANAVSSGAYLLIGMWLAVRALRRADEERPVAIAYGVALASVGIGSFLFHGPMPPGSRLVHDLTIAAVFAVIAARAAGALRQWSHGGVLGVAALITGVIGAVMAASPEAGIALSGVVGIAGLGLEVYLYRSGRRPLLTRRHLRWLIGTVLVLAAAGLVNVLGRTDAPLCDPDSLYQGHALWHVMTAVAFGMFGAVTFSADDEGAA